ncbi:ABC-type sugar transport system, permease component [Neorhizobium galegae bv. officinalis bv. officinalis str. HAMBI 1141]|uniref:ABC-type sugar transport system, permease component n=1 Tax=Neorhizobium galegae bv. officinalis bv. officinalis str. HAMBI 1141 TaxID=1028801 RepID=A0A068T9D4_NEOGA|nr:MULTISPECIES: carbohydrate ABC transporter permease [Neorhizobium]MCJ9670103.1 carbohydrate ABC transporter permease [Neorhizobium sp. SHOUNA12B]MCJ9744120.1 carbohydrate ABC transporter permease [Neorhizobium sp. SHOUNA12A]MCJ9751692.1 carbohydrate ABC transporter permease [Neorhizobium sp. BETTINA12A]CDN54646.1 ABC-type sugar transport system, permease component [Neorhizobium galegae bv. officinalis bv. officinalis str. HAMBI 1141]
MSTASQSYYDRRGMLATLGKDGLIQIILILNTVVMLAPIVIMLFAAFKTNAQIFQSPFGIPDFSNLANIVKIWSQTNFLRYLLNSVIVTGASIVVILTLGTMAAYAVGRYKFRGSSFVLMFFLAGLTLPLKLAIIPLFILMRDLGILNTQLSLIVIYVAMGLPTTVFIMTGFIATLPNELEDAARMDGASEPRIMWSIMLPLVRPALVIAGIQNVVPIWNDFFFPLIFIQKDNLKTLPQGLTTFMGEYTTDWGVLFAGLLLSSAPVIIVYIILSRQFINGMTAGAVK